MMAASQPFPLATLYQLVEQAPVSYRSARYDGSAMSVSLDTYNPADQVIIKRLYDAIGKVFELTRYRQNDPSVLHDLKALVRAENWSDLIQDVQSLGVDITGDASTRIRQVTHDLRGGAFQALAMRMQLLDIDPEMTTSTYQMFFLSRDHLKIMRNALPDLDPVGNDRDTEQRMHHIELIVEKWQSNDYRLQKSHAEVHVRSEYTGAIAERCLEFSALDRVIYNLINNATTHSADGNVDVAILPLPSDDPQHLRIVVSNPISAEQQAVLNERFPDGPDKLFFGGFTTSGSGIGLRICADFVCNAYGVGFIDQGLEEGHFGARIIDDHFVIWVHWPLAGD